MSRVVNYKKKVINQLEQLTKDYPSFGVGRHISTALSDYGDFWGITDKEFSFALDKYIAQLDLDENSIAAPDYIDKIIEDAKHLFDAKTDDEDEYESL